jgi:hypothetical protein
MAVAGGAASAFSFSAFSVAGFVSDADAGDGDSDF